MKTKLNLTFVNFLKIRTMIVHLKEEEIKKMNDFPFYFYVEKDEDTISFLKLRCFTSISPATFIDFNVPDELQKFDNARYNKTMNILDRYKKLTDY